MKKILLLSIGFSLLSNLILAQSKKELQAEVERLTSEIQQKDEELREAKKNESISVANAAAFEAQVSELQDANATLLNNLKIFTEASKQRSESIGQTLESLRDKEAKLKVINDEFSKNDSIALLVLTGFKQTLGEEAVVGVDQAAVTVELNKVSLFGTTANNANLSSEGQAFLAKISDIVKAYPETGVTLLSQKDTVSGTSVVDQRSLSILSSLKEGQPSESGRIGLLTKDSGVEAYQIRIHPLWDRFYLRVREAVKER